MFDRSCMKVYSNKYKMPRPVADFNKTNKGIDFIVDEIGKFEKEIINSTEDSYIVMPTRLLHEFFCGEIVENKQEKIKEETEIEISENEVEEDVSEENESNKFITKRKR